MGSMRHDPKGDRRTRGNQSAPQGGTPSPVTPEAKALSLSLDNAHAELGDALEPFSMWDHGYLKFKRDSGGPEIHLTFTWTLGSHTGSYVYVRVAHWELAVGLQVLARKVYAVDNGTLKPTWDSRRARQE